MFTENSEFNYLDYQASLNAFELINAPKELFFEGNISLLTQDRRVCVVGSREVSMAGSSRAKFITEYLVSKKITVVSGLAKGVDTIAHQVAMKNGNTIAVLGTPLNKCYPAENKILLKEIKEKHLAISQFSDDSNTYQSNFPARNKTMALISDATIIVEAGETSGTQHQGWEALRIKRQLFIMENVVNKVSWAKKMLDYGAEVLTKSNYQDLVDEIPVRSFSENLLEWI